DKKSKGKEKMPLKPKKARFKPKASPKPHPFDLCHHCFKKAIRRDTVQSYCERKRRKVMMEHLLQVSM
ncbi:hypothetical protein, partial [Vibrio vulnificus]